MYYFNPPDRIYTGDNSIKDMESFEKSIAQSRRIGTELFGRIGYYIEYSEVRNINAHVEEVIYGIHLQKAVNY